MAIKYTKQAGDISVNTTWDNNTMPASGDTCYILHACTLSNANFNIGSGVIYISGSLTIQNSRTITAATIYNAEKLSFDSNTTLTANVSGNMLQIGGSRAVIISGILHIDVIKRGNSGLVLGDGSSLTANKYEVELHKDNCKAVRCEATSSAATLTLSATPTALSAIIHKANCTLFSAADSSKFTISVAPANIRIQAAQGYTMFDNCAITAATQEYTTSMPLTMYDTSATITISNDSALVAAINTKLDNASRKSPYDKSSLAAIAGSL